MASHLPASMIKRSDRNGNAQYFWAPPPKLIKAGIPLKSICLGEDIDIAAGLARRLNRQLYRWRTGKRSVFPACVRTPEPQLGTLGWMVETYYETLAFTELGPRAKRTYRYLLGRALKIRTTEGHAITHLSVAAVSPAIADKIYEELCKGQGRTAITVANNTVKVLARVWRVMRVRYPDQFPREEPWRGIVARRQYTAKPAATRAEAYALSAALTDLGHPHLAAVPLICFEWLMRPENVLAGCLKWSDWRTPEQPKAVRLFHGKTGEVVILPLEEKGRRIFPELETLLTALPRLGAAIVMTPGKRRPSRLYSPEYAAMVARQARTRVGLPAHITFDACRHGGLTELGYAGLTEQEIMLLSGHRCRDTLLRYVKRTDVQREASVRKRFRWRSSHGSVRGVGTLIWARKRTRRRKLRNKAGQKTNLHASY